MVFLPNFWVLGNISSLWRAFLCQHPVWGFQITPQMSGKRNGEMGLVLEATQPAALGMRKKKMGPKKGMKARKGLWSGSGESSPRVRALLPLALGDLGSFSLVPYDTFA